jgi:hypothetical protein
MTMAQIRQVGEWPAIPIQRWMQAHDEKNPTSGYYVLPFTWSIAGHVDWRCFTAAFEAICTRHPVLRGSLRRERDSWVQTVRPYDEVPVHFRDATALSGQALDQLLQASYDEYCRRPFVLSTEAPIRVLVLQLANEALVLGAYHQAVCDIESMAVFVSEFNELYSANVEGTEPDLPDPGLDFGAYAVAAEPTQRAQQARNLEFWADRLTGVDLRCPLPVDYPDAADAPFGPTEYFKIGGPPTARAVHAMALELRCSEHAILLAAYSRALTRRCGQSFLVVSCPITLRRSAELFRTFGPLTDMMWLRSDVDTGLSFGEQAKQTFRSILQALSHPCPIDAVLDRATADSPNGERSGPNIQCQYFPAERIANPAWVKSSVQVKQVMPVYLLTGPLHSPYWLDLTVAGERVQPDTDYSLVYRTDLFRAETAREIAGEIEEAIMGGVARGA